MANNGATGRKMNNVAVEDRPWLIGQSKAHLSGFQRETTKKRLFWGFLWSWASFRRTTHNGVVHTVLSARINYRKQQELGNSCGRCCIYAYECIPAFKAFKALILLFSMRFIQATLRACSAILTETSATTSRGAMALFCPWCRPTEVTANNRSSATHVRDTVLHLAMQTQCFLLDYIATGGVSNMDSCVTPLERPISGDL